MKSNRRHRTGRGEREIVESRFWFRFGWWCRTKASPCRSQRPSHWRDDRKNGRKAWGRQCWSETFVPYHIPALYHDIVRAFGALWHRRSWLWHRLVSLDHRSLAAGFLGCEYTFLPNCYYLSSSKHNNHLFFHFQHHEQVQKYSSTLETLLFSSDLDSHILDVFQQFIALTA